MVGHIPHSWQGAREAWGHRPRLYNVTLWERKRWCCLWLRSLTTNGTQQLVLSSLFIFQANQVDVRNGGEYPLWCAVLHPHGKQFALCSSWVLDKSRRPFWLRVKRVQIIGGKDSDGLLRLDSGFLHLQNEIGAREEIPRLDDDGIACLFQLPGDPLGPLSVGFIITDEKVFSDVLHRFVFFAQGIHTLYV